MVLQFPHKIKTLTCCHVFHPKCINTWLFENQTCPVCREPQPTNMLTLEESEDETSDAADDEAVPAPERPPRPRIPPPPPPIETETSTIQENRIIRNRLSFLSTNRHASPRTRLRNAREAVANIRERYSFRRRHSYNLRPRSEL